MSDEEKQYPIEIEVPPGSIDREALYEGIFPFDWFEYEAAQKGAIYDKYRIKLKDFAVFQGIIEGPAFIGMDAAEAISAYDVVALDGSGNAIQGDKTAWATSQVIGFAATSCAGAGVKVRVVSVGEFTGFSGLSPNEPLYLSTSGDYVQSLAGFSDGEYVVPLGVAKDATTVIVSIQQPLLFEKYHPPTYVELQGGYTEGGGTKTPTPPTIAICEAVATKAIRITWDRQLNLTNFDHYELQVSDNDSTWYSLETDGSDWKDILNGDTDHDVELFIHSGIPHGGTAGAPTGKTLYYRIRRAIKVGSPSSWSSSANAITNTVGAGDLAANTIYANNIIAAQALIMLLRSAALWVGYDGTGTYDSPDEGDRRIYQDGDEILFQIYTKGTWSTERQIAFGGVDSNSNFRPFLGCRGVLGDITDSPLLDPIPTRDHHLFKFNNNAEDQHGNDPWTVTLGAFVYDSGTKWEGTHSLAPSATMLNAWYAGGWAIGDSVTGCFMFRDNDYAVIGHDILEWGASSDNDRINLKYGSNHKIKLEIEKNTSVSSVESGVLTQSAWHFVGVTYNSTTNTAYLRVDGDQYSFSPTGSWGSGTKSIYLTLIGGATYHRFMDDLLFSHDTAMDPDLFFQHVTRNVAWTADYFAKDILLKPRSGGAVMVDGDLEIAGSLKPSYETVWINRSDWTNVHLGSTITKNTDSNMTHNLNAPLNELLVRVLVSSDGTDANSFEVARAGYGHFGYTPYQISTNAIKIQTGSSGLTYHTDAGTNVAIAAQDWFYKIKVWRLG